MNISQEARNAAVRIAMKHISLNPDEAVVAQIAIDVQQAVDAVRAHESSYFIMRDTVAKPFWNGMTWVDTEQKRVYVDFDEAVKAYRKANLETDRKVVIAHSTPQGVVRYQPL